MAQNDPSATFNTLLCAEVMLTLMFYHRGSSRYRPWISHLAWLLTVIYNAVPLTYLCGIYPYSSWAIIEADIIFLSMLIAVRDNVARLVDRLGQ